MKVSLIDFTGNGHYDPDHAINMLLFTKNTRLQMSPGLLDEIAAWPHERKLDELAYMAKTIPSSWEFVDYTFMIEGVTRAFTHQFVRTRTASYAQQTMRVLNVEGWDYLTGPTIDDEKSINGSEDGTTMTAKELYEGTMADIALAYDRLIESGVAIEDARGILPTNILTNIVAKMNMRTFVEMVRKRRGPRTQGEYRDVLSAMEAQVLSVHPWVSMFINSDADLALLGLDKAIKEWVPAERQTDMLKLVDMIRRG